MHAYRVAVRTEDGDVVEGVAKDIRYADGKHCLILEQDKRSNRANVSVVIEKIATLTALTKNPYFSSIVAD
jgi:transcriptional antiterminator Rof (Rho-off)